VIAALSTGIASFRKLRSEANRYGGIFQLMRQIPGGLTISVYVLNPAITGERRRSRQASFDFLDWDNRIAVPNVASWEFARKLGAVTATRIMDEDESPPVRHSRFLGYSADCGRLIQRIRPMVDIDFPGAGIGYAVGRSNTGSWPVREGCPILA
jgi:hypothetical protein